MASVRRPFSGERDKHHRGKRPIPTRPGAGLMSCTKIKEIARMTADDEQLGGFNAHIEGQQGDDDPFLCPQG